MNKINGTGGMDFNYIGKVLLFVLGLYSISAVFSFVQGWIMTGITQKLCYRLRKEISEKINRMPMKYFESRTYGEVLSRITNDVDTLGQGLNQSVTQVITSTATGLTQTGNKLKDAYHNPLDQQYVTLGISLPILDWGRGKGQVRVARSNRDLTYTQVEQDKTDFELNVRKLVKQFNLQSQRVHIAARTDETAQRRADVARRLYILGKSTVLDLNASISEKDAARRNYITALYNYWSLYYTLRSITLYDFEVDAPLTETERIEEVMDRMIKK